MLQISPSTYYSAKSRPPSARTMRDAVLAVTLLAIWNANYSVYGVHKMWKSMGRAGETVGRDQVARLMRGMGLVGIRRGSQVVHTTRADEKANRPPDLVDRKFTAEHPNALWVTDLERHEAFLNLAVVKGHRHQLVAAGWLKLRAA